MARVFHIPLRVVFYREEADWIAHCLEFDLLGDGQSKEEAIESLTKAIELQVEASLGQHPNPQNLFSPAPGEFLRMFAVGREVAVGNLSICFEALSRRYGESYQFEDVLVREYVEDVEPDPRLQPA